MKELNIKFVDFYNGFNSYDNTIIEILKERYIIKISEEPDYIFYSCFGNEHLKYSCVRIFITGECLVPDFNVCDYAIGFDILDFQDRYIRVPLYSLFHYLKDYEKAINIRNDQNRTYTDKTGFCSFVVSNDLGQKERKIFFELLGKYKKIDSGGRYLNNIGYCVDDKQDFQRKHKFSIAFENSVYPGYTTEKLIQAFAADSLPIYYGNPLIDKEFNEKAFINCHKYANFEEVIREIIRLDNDDEAYQSAMSQQLHGKDYIPELRDFLFNIFDQDITKCFRRPINARTIQMEKDFLAFDKFNLIFLRPINRFKSFVRRLKKGSIRR